MSLALSLFVLAPAFVQAQAPAPAGAENAIMAYVLADFDEESNLVGLALEEEGGSLYNVVLDQQGRELANGLNGEWVEVSGTVSERDGEVWLTVKSFSKAAQRDEEDQWIEEDESEDWNDPVEPSDPDEETDEGWEEDTWQEEVEETPPESDEEPAEAPDQS
jgi:hypothetical protein